MTDLLSPGNTIGILGGGQLARMLAIAAARYGLKTHVFDPASNAPAAHLCYQHTCAGYTDEAALKIFAQACDVVTYEFENIPRASLDALHAIVPLRPGLLSLQTSQDRLVEKQFLERLGLPVAPYAAIDSIGDLVPAHARLGSDTILKTRRMGYDGKGQARLSGKTDPETAWKAINQQPAVLEARIPFVAEISAIVVRATDGSTCTYDVPVNTHSDGILHTSALGQFAGYQVSELLAGEAQKAAVQVANALGHVGTLAVEFFVTERGALLVNEFAPRVHNSGHWTMDACLTDQFDNHIRAVSGWPLGDSARHSDVLMTNLIGDDVHAYLKHLQQTHIQLHLYGKAEARKGRKMGHITEIAQRMDR